MEKTKKSIGWANWNTTLKKKKINESLEITYNLFMKGKNIAEISKERNYKQDTIERQIIELISKSMIDINDVLELNKFNLIYKSINDDNINSLKDIKEKLPLDISWFEIKSVIAHINSIPKKIKKS